MAHKIKVTRFVDAAHKLPDTPQLITKQCARLHGHTYCIIVEASADTLNEAGMVADFSQIKQVIDRLDHRYLNDVFKDAGVGADTTAENIAKLIYRWCEDLDIKIDLVSVCEGYKGSEQSNWVSYDG